MWQVGKEVHEDPTIALANIARVFQDKTVRELYDLYYTNGNINFRIISTIASVAGYTKSDLLGTRVAGYLQGLPEEVIKGVSVLSALEDLAGFCQDSKTLEDTLAVLEVLREKQGVASVSRFSRALSNVIYEGQCSKDSSEAVKSLKKKIRTLKNGNSWWQNLWLGVKKRVTSIFS